MQLCLARTDHLCQKCRRQVGPGWRRVATSSRGSAHRRIRFVFSSRVKHAISRGPTVRSSLPSRLFWSKRLILSGRLSERRRALAGAAAVAAVAALLPTLAAMTPAEADDQSASPTSTTGAVPELATATSNTVREADGSLTMTAYTEPVNYQDASGEWVAIDNTLVDAPGDAYDVQNAANSFTAKIPEDPSTTPIKLVDDGTWVTMQMEGIADDPAHVADDTASFDDVAKADGVEYQVTNTGVKGAITLNATPTAPLHYTYTLDVSAGLTPTLDDSGGIVVAGQDGADAFTIPAGVMYDSADGDASSSDDVEYSLASDGDAWALTVTPDIDWLTDPARVYPVVIDPSLNGQNDVHDCNLRSAVPDNTACGNQTTYLKAGRSDSSHKYRGVFDFNVTSIPAAATVTNATVHLNLDQSQTLDQTQSADYSLYPAAKKFDGSATWNSSGLSGSWSGGWSSGSAPYATKTMKGDSGGDKPFYGLEGLVQTWVQNPTNNTGLVIKQDGEAINNILSFYSNSSSNSATKRPYIDINYTVPPTISGDVAVGPGGDGWVSSLTPTLSATYTDPANATLDVTYSVIDQGVTVWSGTKLAVPSGQASSIVVPPGTLQYGQRFAVRTMATNGVAASTSTLTPVIMASPCEIFDANGEPLCASGNDVPPNVEAEEAADLPLAPGIVDYLDADPTIDPSSIPQFVKDMVNDINLPPTNQLDGQSLGQVVDNSTSTGSSDAVSTTRWAKCRIRATHPHWSKRGKTVLFKSYVKCWGNYGPTVNVKVDKYLWVKKSKSADMNPVPAAIGSEPRSIPLTDTWSKPFYCPDNGSDVHVKGGGRYFRGLGTLLITSPGISSGLGGDQSPWVPVFGP